MCFRIYCGTLRKSNLWQPCSQREGVGGSEATYQFSLALDSRQIIEFQIYRVWSSSPCSFHPQRTPDAWNVRSGELGARIIKSLRSTKGKATRQKCFQFPFADACWAPTCAWNSARTISALTISIKPNPQLVISQLTVPTRAQTYRGKIAIFYAQKHNSLYVDLYCGWCPVGEQQDLWFCGWGQFASHVRWIRDRANVPCWQHAKRDQRRQSHISNAEY